MITINYRDPRPIYEQIQTELRRLMLSGVLPPGSRLPSVRELAGQLAINPNTIPSDEPRITAICGSNGMRART